MSASQIGHTHRRSSARILDELQPNLRQQVISFDSSRTFGRLCKAISRLILLMEKYLQTSCFAFSFSGVDDELFRPQIPTF